MRYRCYSDASVMNGGSAVGCIVIAPNGDRRAKAVVVDSKASIAAELEGHRIAVEMTPEGSHGTLYSDLHDIELLIDGKVSYAPKHRQEIKRLNEALAKRVFLVEYMPIQQRSRHYGSCHRMARKLAAKRASLNQYVLSNARDKIDGYYLPRPNETPSASFARAKQEAIEQLSKAVQAVECITFEDFMESKC